MQPETFWNWTARKSRLGRFSSGLIMATACLLVGCIHWPGDWEVSTANLASCALCAARSGSSCTTLSDLRLESRSDWNWIGLSARIELRLKQVEGAIKFECVQLGEPSRESSAHTLKRLDEDEVVYSLRTAPRTATIASSPASDIQSATHFDFAVAWADANGGVTLTRLACDGQVEHAPVGIETSDISSLEMAVGSDNTVWVALSQSGTLSALLSWSAGSPDLASYVEPRGNIRDPLEISCDIGCLVAGRGGNAHSIEMLIIRPNNIERDQVSPVNIKHVHMSGVSAGSPIIAGPALAVRGDHWRVWWLSGNENKRQIESFQVTLERDPSQTDRAIGSSLIPNGARGMAVTSRPTAPYLALTLSDEFRIFAIDEAEDGTQLELVAQQSLPRGGIVTELRGVHTPVAEIAVRVAGGGDPSVGLLPCQ